jgi:hypothetical protein
MYFFLLTLLLKKFSFLFLKVSYNFYYFNSTTTNNNNNLRCYDVYDSSNIINYHVIAIIIYCNSYSAYDVTNYGFDDNNNSNS